MLITCNSNEKWGFFLVNVDFNYFLKFCLGTYSGIRTKIHCIDFFFCLASPRFANHRVCCQMLSQSNSPSSLKLLFSCIGDKLEIAEQLAKMLACVLTRRWLSWTIEFLCFFPSLLEKQVTFIFLLAGISLRTFGFHLCSHRTWLLTSTSQIPARKGNWYAFVNFNLPLISILRNARGMFILSILLLAAFPFCLLTYLRFLSLPFPCLKGISMRMKITTTTKMKGLLFHWFTHVLDKTKTAITKKIPFYPFSC